jgi:hypothetical protein
MTVEDIRLIIVSLIGSVAADRYMSTGDFNRIMQTCNLKHFKKKVGLPEQYQPGQPIPKEAFEITKKVSQDISPFKYTMGKKGLEGTPALFVDQWGHAATPTNMYYPSVMSYEQTSSGTTRYREIEIVTDYEWGKRHSDAITYPSVKYPVANFQSGYIRFSPLSDRYVEFTYIRRPVDPVWAGTVSDGYYKYDGATSVQMEWDDVNIIDIIYLMMSEMGIPIEKDVVIQKAEMVKNAGI